MGINSKSYNMLCDGYVVEDIIAILETNENRGEFLQRMSQFIDDRELYDFVDRNDFYKEVIEASPFAKDYADILHETSIQETFSLVCESINKMKELYPEDIDVAYGLYKRGYEIEDALANALEENCISTEIKKGDKIMDLALLSKTFEIPKNSVFLVNDKYYSDMNCEEGIGVEVLDNWFGSQEVKQEIEECR